MGKKYLEAFKNQKSITYSQVWTSCLDTHQLHHHSRAVIHSACMHGTSRPCLDRNERGFC